MTEDLDGFESTSFAFNAFQRLITHVEEDGSEWDLMGGDSKKKQLLDVSWKMMELLAKKMEGFQKKGK